MRPLAWDSLNKNLKNIFELCKKHEEVFLDKQINKEHLKDIQQMILVGKGKLPPTAHPEEGQPWKKRMTLVNS
jgi:hypothetical protein